MSLKKKSSRSRSNSIQAKLRSLQELEGEVGDVLLQMQEKVRQMECLTEFSALLNSTLDTKVVREKALEATGQLLSCETASLFLVDAKSGELYWETALGESGKELQESVRLPINDRSIAGCVAMTGEKIMVNDVASDPRHSKVAQEKTGFRTQNILCVPLKIKGVVIGVLQALNKLPIVPRQKKRQSGFQGEDMKLLETLGHQVAIAIDNSQLYEKLKKNFYETVGALAEAIDKKDRYTGGHTKRVVYYSTCIAKYLDLSQEEMDSVRLGAILHDVGKIGVEDKILKKPAPLDPYEWPVMKTHPELGYQIMKGVSGMNEVIQGMRLHHERWDGKGYPLGLEGEEIPLVARIIAVADTYDAMVSTRPYRKGLAPVIAYDEIVKNAGTQFCPKVVKAFQEAFQNEKMGKGSGGSQYSLDPALKVSQSAV